MVSMSKLNVLRPILNVQLWSKICLTGAQKPECAWLGQKQLFFHIQNCKCIMKHAKQMMLKFQGLNEKIELIRTNCHFAACVQNWPYMSSETWMGTTMQINNFFELKNVNVWFKAQRRWHWIFMVSLSKLNVPRPIFNFQLWSKFCLTDAQNHK